MRIPIKSTKTMIYIFQERNLLALANSREFEFVARTAVVERSGVSCMFFAEGPCCPNCRYHLGGLWQHVATEQKKVKL